MQISDVTLEPILALDATASDVPAEVAPDASLAAAVLGAATRATGLPEVWFRHDQTPSLTDAVVRALRLARQTQPQAPAAVSTARESHGHRRRARSRPSASDDPSEPAPPPRAAWIEEHPLGGSRRLYFLGYTPEGALLLRSATGGARWPGSRIWRCGGRDPLVEKRERENVSRLQHLTVEIEELARVTGERLAALRPICTRCGEPIDSGDRAATNRVLHRACEAERQREYRASRRLRAAA